MKKWVVYYINSESQREGAEYILAETKKEAEIFYKRYFNVDEDCKVLPVLPGLIKKNEKT